MSHMLRIGPQLLCTALVLLGLGACTSNQALVKPCCYDGAVTLAKLTDLELIRADGQAMAFAEAFPGYQRSHAAIATAPARLEDFYIDNIGYAALEAAVAPHDWNRNGRLEDPEATSFYVWEAAKGLGIDLREVRMQGAPVGALQTSVADLGTLLDYVSAHRDRVSPVTIDLFRQLEFEAEQQRIQNIDGGESPRAG